MSLFDRFRSNKSESRIAKAALARELAGELGAAVDLYIQAELPNEAARVLLIRADGERSIDKRMAFCSIAARTAVDVELKKKAFGRKALLGFDVLRGQGGAFLRSEMLAAARDLEEAGELERAAEAYALGGDGDGEVRALTSAGAIERLEERLSASDDAARDRRERDLTLRKIGDLERTAERRAALAVAKAWLALHDDERVADAARAIRSRLARGPIVELEIHGVRARYALGDEVTIGRGDATIVVPSRAISRRHLRVRRIAGEIVVEDLETRNGTALAGARITSPIAVGEGVSLELGGEIACKLTRSSAGVSIEIGGGHYTAALGDLEAGAWRVGFESAGEDTFVVLRTPEGSPHPVLGEFELAPAVELAGGDEILSERRGKTVLRVVGAREGSPVEP